MNTNALIDYKFTSYIMMSCIAFIFAIFLIVRRSRPAIFPAIASARDDSGPRRIERDLILIRQRSGCGTRIAESTRNGERSSGCRMFPGAWSVESRDACLEATGTPAEA